MERILTVKVGNPATERAVIDLVAAMMDCPIESFLCTRARKRDIDINAEDHRSEQGRNTSAERLGACMGGVISHNEQLKVNS